MKDFTRLDNLIRTFVEQGTGIWVEADPVDDRRGDHYETYRSNNKRDHFRII